MIFPNLSYRGAHFQWNESLTSLLIQLVSLLVLLVLNLDVCPNFFHHTHKILPIFDVPIPFDELSDNWVIPGKKNIGSSV